VAMSGILDLVRGLDVHYKTVDDARDQTISGATVSIISGICILLLVFSEVSLFLTVTQDHSLQVDVSRGGKLRINFDILFHSLPCSVLSLDSMDVSGGHELDVVQDVYKRKVNKEGEVYGPVLHEKVDTNGEEKDAVKKLQGELGEGCSVYGSLQVSKVAGNFHFSMHAQDFHVLTHVFSHRDSINVSHTINHLSFGEDYPGISNPLDNNKKVAEAGSGMCEYYIKVVPTEFVDIDGNTLKTNQYSVTDHVRASNDGFPAVYFLYDLSPIMVRVKESRTGFSHFIVQAMSKFAWT